MVQLKFGNGRLQARQRKRCTYCFSACVLLAALYVTFVKEDQELESQLLELVAQKSLEETITIASQEPEQRPQHVLSQLAKANSHNEYKAKMLKRLADTVEVCGALCEINSVSQMKAYMVEQRSNQYFPQLQVPLKCEAILSSPLLDVSDTSIPYPIPEELRPFYGMIDEHGDAAVDLQKIFRYKNIYAGTQAKQPVWEEADVEQLMQDSERGELEGNYGRRMSAQIRAALERYGSLSASSNSRVLVIGSENPWVEAICLSLGAASVTTLEYGTIISHHPRIQTMTPSQMQDAHKEGKLELFDLVVSFSSVEHSGLGRYGDGLNPWGDLLAMARAWCWTKSKGRLLLGVPTGKDRIEFNGCRVYGVHRWPLLSANWKLVNEEQLVEWGEMEVGLEHSANAFSMILTNMSYYQPSLMFEKVGGN